MNCYRNGGCGPYEMLSCSECPASKPDYQQYKVIKCENCAFLDHRVGYCKKCNAMVAGTERELVCEFAEEKQKTNWDLLREMSANEFSHAFWAILKQSQWYTDSRVWLREWLNAVPAGGMLDLQMRDTTKPEDMGFWMK